MKKLILLAVMCLVYHTLFADETTPTPKSDAHLYGHVIDSKTGEHLPYATVTIPGTTIGTMTDASGHYFLKNLPTGTITVEARMMSYDPVRHEVTLKKGQSLELNFEITENGITMDDVVVSASRSETTRRKAPALVNVLDRKIFDNTNSACLARGLVSSPAYALRTTVRTAVLCRCASTDSTDTIRRFSSIRIPSFRPFRAFMDWSRFRPA